MALTTRGKRLTEAHRRAQIALAAQGEAVARELWSSVAAGRIQMSRDVWLARSLLAASSYHDDSASLAADYVSSYRAVEADGATGPVLLPRFDPARVATSLSVAGPATTYMQMRRGVPAPLAHRAAGNAIAGSFRRHAMAGGRGAVDLTSRADQKVIGWRRVTDGNPCAFCAMLASRGPVYGGQSAARAGAGGNRYHDFCGCTTELVYGEWKPSETEEKWIADYQAAAAEADGTEGRRRAPYWRNGKHYEEDTILSRLRQQGYR